MKIIVINLDRCKWLPLKYRKRLNEKKICTIIPRDFGKKTLIGLPKGDPECLKSHKSYEDAIFKLKDDDQCLKYENAHFRRIAHRIKWFRTGVLLRREKACKILLALLGEFYG